ncbi:hypothetical protein L1887_23248 [Cichorium endivia]|nr:hypothetical protein L1887_23248 [Cichorium endivia]
MQRPLTDVCGSMRGLCDVGDRAERRCAMLETTISSEEFEGLLVGDCLCEMVRREEKKREGSSRREGSLRKSGVSRVFGLAGNWVGRCDVLAERKKERLV